MKKAAKKTTKALLNEAYGHAQKARNILDEIYNECDAALEAYNQIDNALQILDTYLDK